MSNNIQIKMLNKTTILCGEQVFNILIRLNPLHKMIGKLNNNYTLLKISLKDAITFKYLTIKKYNK